MDRKETILVVDDDKEIVELMQDFLEDEGYRVEKALDAEKARQLLNQVPVDCILLDVMMPGQDGFELCREIRKNNDVPILFLSARDGDMDKIRGLGIGGDDYIVKSATPVEVVARVKAVLRRYRKQVAPQKAVLRYGPLLLDVRAHEVFVHGKPVSLTPKEFDILLLFAEHPRQVFTYDQLLEKFWDGVGDKHTVVVHISRIREKIEEDPNHPKWIVNVWGVGYRFEGA
ncbi:response regulator transcription factor [Thermoactinomyces intermedius]|jgi:DNA-binding response OmpR family regulator|uniref:Response regulator transcription factor n=1 Tax=Thermoactinomyces intermedius TaxID=2024 RepID=A0A8I1DF88_THEIN|nr:response regulator transcription factor [Thermoactinomyces intermedius]MBA4548708.1 response regulator transcription factor [Thermoactinomyces intermedius]MBA4836782.1 response regulator transcription factor [Thermoactinomyces intermedius]MBH8594586.1 response regulator transcription factor [Thermoactinomyces intermedius]